MAKQTIKEKKEDIELDSVYFLKIVLYFLMGSMWVSFGESGIAVPVGLAAGLIFASHDHFKIDRKIEVVVLLIASVLSFVAPIGFVLTV